MERLRERKLISIPRGAEYCGIATQTLRNRLCRNSPNPFPVKPVYIGGKPLLDIDELDEMIERLKAERDQKERKNWLNQGR